MLEPRRPKPARRLERLRARPEQQKRGIGFSPKIFHEPQQPVAIQNLGSRIEESVTKSLGAVADASCPQHCFACALLERYQLGIVGPVESQQVPDLIFELGAIEAV